MSTINLTGLTAATAAFKAAAVKIINFSIVNEIRDIGVGQSVTYNCGTIIGTNAAKYDLTNVDARARASIDGGANYYESAAVLDVVTTPTGIVTVTNNYTAVVRAEITIKAPRISL